MFAWQNYGVKPDIMHVCKSTWMWRSGRSVYADSERRQTIRLFLVTTEQHTVETHLSELLSMLYLNATRKQHVVEHVDMLCIWRKAGRTGGKNTTASQHAVEKALCRALSYGCSEKSSTARLRTDLVISAGSDVLDDTAACDYER